MAKLTAIAPIVSAISGIVSVVSFIKGKGAKDDAFDSRQAALTEQREANKVQQKVEELRASRERRTQVRRARVARAQVVNQASQTVGGDSSGAQGGAGSVSSQLSGNLSFLDTNLGLARQRNTHLDNAALHTTDATNSLSDASTFDSLFNASSKVFDLAGGFGSLGKIGS